ncbi:4-alpha-glucanotransferase [Yanghanlia caeni]|uniref:4-alpha-glucanotransferase n=1 Tax=Yanghanlia caeni TaxID=3064283 RepID=A0ABU1D335_9BURK|nr:4-alpha-glucanotransferase [Alcaligenaceae bacterium LG-2]
MSIATHMLEPELRELAEEAGLLVTWRDAHGRERQVGAQTLRSLLDALHVPCANPAQCCESLHALRVAGYRGASPRIVVAQLGQPVFLRRHGSLHYRLQREDGTYIMGTARDLDGDYVAISGLNRPGYYQLEMGAVHTVIAVAPRRCPTVTELAGRTHAWVLGAQVYSLRRGVANGASDAAGAALPGWETGGDYTALGILARQAAAHGAAGLAISPVHAMFSADPQRYSPYAPSSRLFLNALHADPVAVLGRDFVLAAGVTDGGVAPPDGPQDGLLDWPQVYARRLSTLRRLHQHFDAAASRALQTDFEAFVREGGQALFNHASFEALHAHYAETLGASHGWQDWPAEYRDPSSAAVRRFSAAHEDALRFHLFLQWLAARNLGQAHAGAREAGMPLGLVADMAVGTDPGGSQAWSQQGQLMTGVSVGAPPDIFQPEGQDWGLTAFSPHALHEHGHDGFIQIVRAALAHAGGLRVDHILGLARMWLVPQGAPPAEGAYLRYPRDELMNLLALEAWRHRALVVGENLGTVPEDFTEAMSRHGILGMNVLWFEQDSTAQRPAFRPRSEWPGQSMAMITTHDLPTLSGWWVGRDIEWRERQGEFDAQAAEAQRRDRAAQKGALWQALQRAGLISDGAAPHEPPTGTVLAYVAGAPSVVCSVALEDVLESPEQPNLPESGRRDAQLRHPNWRRMLEPAVETMLEGERVAGLLGIVRKAREQAPSLEENA